MARVELLMMTRRNGSVGARARGVAISMAVLLLVFCLSSVAPATAEVTGCSGPDPSPRMCGPSGVASVVEHVVVVALEIPSALWAAALVGSSAVAAAAAPISRFHASPSPPRAPPFSLA
jgi:hypothetical protein